jgi:hypothetical protein
MPDLAAAAVAAVQRLDAEDRRTAALVGKAMPALRLTVPAGTAAGSPGISRLIETRQPDGVGNADTVQRDLGRPLLRRPDGSRMAFVAGASGAIGPSTLPGSFIALRGHLALRTDRAEADGAFRRYVAVGPVVGIDGASQLGGVTITGGGVGAHFESGVAIPVPRDGTAVEVGGYADVMSDRNEGGLLLRVRTGP